MTDDDITLIRQIVAAGGANTPPARLTEESTIGWPIWVG
jgi:hypothetical protein